MAPGLRIAAHISDHAIQKVVCSMTAENNRANLSFVLRTKTSSHIVRAGTIQVVQVGVSRLKLQPLNLDIS